MNTDDHDPSHPVFQFPPNAGSALHNHINHPYQQSHEAQSGANHPLMAAAR